MGQTERMAQFVADNVKDDLRRSRLTARGRRTYVNFDREADHTLVVGIQIGLAHEMTGALGRKRQDNVRFLLLRRPSKSGLSQRFFEYHVPLSHRIVDGGLDCRVGQVRGEDAQRESRLRMSEQSLPWERNVGIFRTSDGRHDSCQKHRHQRAKP